MDLDLQQDAADVYAFVVSQTAAYTPTQERGPGEPGDDAVRMVYAGYEFAQAGWFALVFDRRPAADHDGEWTMHIDENVIERSGWVAASERNNDSPIQFRGEDGQVRELPAGSDFGSLLGRMIVGVLQRAERDGVFTSLPRADGFRLGLEEFNGSFGWDSRTGFGGDQPE